VEIFFRERGARWVVFRSHYADLVLALGCDFRYQRSGFAAAQDEQVHGCNTFKDLTTVGTEGHRGRSL
jgi:hypothetical protein